jgi:hypothetical protein
MLKFFSRKTLFKSIFASVFGLAGYLSSAAAARAQAISAWTEEEGCIANVDGVTVATFRGIECLLRNVLASATTMIGLAAFVMLIIGAFLYLTSGGNTKGTEAAKQTITYAIIGILVALMAYFIIAFIAGFTGVGSILRFNLNIQ